MLLLLLVAVAAAATRCDLQLLLATFDIPVAALFCILLFHIALLRWLLQVKIFCHSVAPAAPAALLSLLPLLLLLPLLPLLPYCPPQAQRCAQALASSLVLKGAGAKGNKASLALDETQLQGQAVTAVAAAAAETARVQLEVAAAVEEHGRFLGMSFPEDSCFLPYVLLDVVFVVSCPPEAGM